MRIFINDAGPDGRFYTGVLSDAGLVSLVDEVNVDASPRWMDKDGSWRHDNPRWSKGTPVNLRVAQTLAELCAFGPQELPPNAELASTPFSLAAARAAHWARHEIMLRRKEIGVRQIEAAILAELRAVTNNKQIRQKNIVEWSTGDVKAEAGETVVHLPHLVINVAYRNETDVAK